MVLLVVCIHAPLLRALSPHGDEPGKGCLSFSLRGMMNSASPLHLFRVLFRRQGNLIQFHSWKCDRVRH
ncbi:putative glutamate synthase [Clarias magur]|uniref:Putative glutamate synthase n=1 Tax=Clarias magur TaxID=1594786 RepID=A0A8J4WZH6_CLAMG|nr:putative glutamate synthase [Clarias magur]